MWFQRIQQTFKSNQLWTLLAGTLVLMGGALYNEFPLLTGDSAVYISSGFVGKALSERPVFYGLFIRLSSLGISLWGVVFFQSLILSDLLIRQMRKWANGISNLHILGILCLTAVFTDVVWESGKIMADVFMVFIILAVMEWLFSKEASPGRKIYLFILILFSSITHNSHAMVLLLAAILMMVAAFILSKRQYLSRITALLLIAALAPILIGLSNMVSGNGFTLGKATSVFLVGKMCENGMLHTFLEKHCDEGKYKLCGYKDSLPQAAWQFVWHPESPVMKMGGWEASDQEFRQILRQSFREPEFLWMHIWKSVYTTAVQFFQISAGDALFRYEETDNTMQSIRRYYLHEVNPALWTRQRILELDFKFYSRLYGLFFLVTGILLLFVWHQIPHRKEMLILLLVLLLFLVLNAAVTGNLANISSRLQARVFWLWPFWNVLILWRWKRGD